MAQATRTEIAALYVGTYDRAADSDGMDYWANTGLSAEEISEFFYKDQDESADLEDLTNAEFVNWAFDNSFGMDADPDGLVYWVDQLEGGLDRGTLVLWVQNGATNDDNPDKTVLENRTAVSLDFAASDINGLC